MDDVSYQMALAELAKRAARLSLVAACHLLWPIINPGVKLIWGKHLDALCLHLEALTERRIRRLLINMPPGHGKTSIISHIWPIWEWARYPHRRWICASHSLRNSIRENSVRRRLIRSKLYQDVFKPSWQLTKGRRQVAMFENDQGGLMLTTSTGSRDVLGWHADSIIVDDPIDTQAVHTVALRECEEWWRTKMVTRVRDPENTAFVLVMQRLAPGDLSDVWLKWGVDAHLSMPAMYDPDRDPGLTAIGWSDWRTERGEVLFPERFSRHWLEQRKYIMGSKAFAAQFEQQPIDEESAKFKPAWWLRHKSLPASPDAWVGVIDMAQEGGEGHDYSVAQVWCVAGDTAYLCEQIRLRLDYVLVRKEVKALSDRWPTCQYWRCEARSLGPAMLSDLRSMGVPGVVGWKSQDPKPVRIATTAPLVEAAQVSVPVEQGAPWTKEFFEEAEAYPASRYDDQLDAMAMALLFLAPGLRAARLKHMNEGTAQSVQMAPESAHKVEVPGATAHGFQREEPQRPAPGGSRSRHWGGF